MSKCSSFNKCSAPLCPLDPEISRRIWYADEPVCISARFGKHRWIRKQRSIQRRGTKSWQNRPVTYDQLFKASRPREISEDRRKGLSDRLRKIRENRLSHKTISNPAIVLGSSQLAEGDRPPTGTQRL